MKKLILATLLTVALCATYALFGQDATTNVAAPAASAVAAVPNATPVAPVVIEGLPAWASDLAAKLPWLPKVLLWLGIVAGLIRPAFDFLHAVVRGTPSTWDDKMLAKCEESKWFKWVLTALKYVTGIKVIHPDTSKV